MAIGVGKMLNINIPVNFYSPYKSKSITEFWKRWHITLGRALTKIVYIPLGGNRKGLARTCINLFIVFLVSGLWHGAAWTFVIWGILHGIVRVFEKLFERSIEKVPSLIRIFITFMFVNVAWVFFNAQSVGNALTLLKKMFIPDSLSFTDIGKLALDNTLTYTAGLQTVYVAVFVAALVLGIFLIRKNSIDWYNEFKPNVKIALITAVLFCLSIIHLSKATIFIYFNF